MSKIKIFKTILIFSMCFLISIPANCAISVSDDTAFITRAEALSVAQSLTERVILLRNTLDGKLHDAILKYYSEFGRSDLSGKSQSMKTTSLLLSAPPSTYFNSVAHQNIALFSGTLVENVSKTGLYRGSLICSRGGKKGSGPNSLKHGYRIYPSISNSPSYDNGRVNGTYMRNYVSGNMTDGSSFVYYLQIFRKLANSSQVLAFSQVIARASGTYDYVQLGDEEFSIESSNGSSMMYYYPIYEVYTILPGVSVNIPYSFFVNRGETLMYQLFIDYNSTVSTRQSAMVFGNSSYASAGSAINIGFTTGVVY